MRGINTLNFDSAVFLCPAVSEGQCCHAGHHYEHLRTSEGAAAGPLLLRPQRAAGYCAPHTPVWSQCHLPLTAVALLHVDRRGPHHYHGEAHSVPVQAVWRDRKDQEVKKQLWRTNIGHLKNIYHKRECSGQTTCCDLLQTSLLFEN